MNRVFEAAWEVQRFCEAECYRFCFIGGLALQRWGEPRMTVDVDLTVISGFGSEEPIVDSFLARFDPRIEEARAFALHNRVLLLKSEGGVGLDVALGAMPFEERAMERASAFRLEDGRSLTTCSAEDLIVHKAFANRDQDWVDIKGILIRQKGKLDIALIFEELAPLVALKEEPAILERLREAVGTLG